MSDTKRPRLTRGQIRALTHLAYVTHRAMRNREAHWPVREIVGAPAAALLRHGYVMPMGLGYMVAAKGLMRAKRALVATNRLPEAREAAGGRKSEET